VIRLLSGCCTVIFFLLSASPAAAQEAFSVNPQAGTLFDSGMVSFRQREYPAALRWFDSAIAVRPVHQRTTAAEIMAGKTLFEQMEFRKSASRLTSFLHRYPYSEYADDARYSLGLDFMMLQAYADAAGQLLRSIEMTSDPVLRSRAVQLFRNIADERLSESEIRHLLDQQSSADGRDLVSMTLANKLYAQGKNPLIPRVLEQILLRSPRSLYADEAMALEQDISRGAQRVVGVMLPLMKNSSPNPVSSLASEMLEGMTFAIREAKTAGAAAWVPDLQVRDTQRDSALSLSIIRAMVADTNTLAVIGPLFSNLAALCAPVAEMAGVPLVTPTAAADGIAATGRHIFQLSPDYTSRGRMMARYAVEELGAASLAVLGSADPMSQAMAAGFIMEAKRLGAAIIAKQYFPAGTTDLRDQFVEIRSAAISAGMGRGSAENFNDPVTGLAAVYVPLSDAGDVGIIASQVSYYNIRTQILGSNEWYDPGQLNANKRYLNGVIFTSDWYIDDSDSTVSAFRQEFSARMHHAPTKYTYTGYDAVKLLLAKTSAGFTRRESMTNALGRVRDFRGLHLPVTLEEGRVNSSIHILQYRDGDVRHVRLLTP
jgi:branched-chain amino acid transport system substrate-binding protein